jgi:hypothetical protein
MHQTVKTTTVSCGDPQGQHQLQVRLHTCAYTLAPEDNHNDFDKNLGESCLGSSDVGWTTQYKCWTLSAYGKRKWKQL